MDGAYSLGVLPRKDAKGDKSGGTNLPPLRPPTWIIRGGCTSSTRAQHVCRPPVLHSMRLSEKGKPLLMISEEQGGDWDHSGGLWAPVAMRKVPWPTPSPTPACHQANALTGAAHILWVNRGLGRLKGACAEDVVGAQSHGVHPVCVALQGAAQNPLKAK